MHARRNPNSVSVILTCALVSITIHTPAEAYSAARDCKAGQHNAFVMADCGKDTSAGGVRYLPRDADGGGGGGSSSSKGPLCKYVPADPPAGKSNEGGQWYRRYCRGYGRPGMRGPLVFVPDGQAAPPTVTPYELALRAYSRLRPPAPSMMTAPPRGSLGFVGLRHFYWADRVSWTPVTERETDGGVWAEVTATPVRLEIAPGAGQTQVICQGPGTPYNHSLVPAQQKTDCSHVYTRSSAGLAKSQYQVSVRAVWEARWSGSGGAGGTFAPITLTTTFPVSIGEAQALI